MSTRYLTAEELAARLAISTNAVYIINSRGTGPKVTHLGRRVRYAVEDVEAWEQAQQDQGEELVA